MNNSKQGGDLLFISNIILPVKFVLRNTVFAESSTALIRIIIALLIIDVNKIPEIIIIVNACPASLGGLAMTYWHTAALPCRVYE
ncbi:MAG: hypothetical protein J7K40_00095 [candidate division Zixibacteria bacterium]|nr:hypothetical protein [candidate division Zixibacteria bacterium]